MENFWNLRSHEKLTIAIFKSHEKLMKKKKQCFRNWYEPVCGFLFVDINMEA